MNYSQTIKQQEVDFVKEFTRENPDLVKERRLEFLNKELKKINVDYLYWIKTINSIKTIWYKAIIEKVCLKPLIKKWNRIYREIDMYKHPKPTTNEITDERIEEARAYPFENLIEIKKKFALCPFHNDHHPSFYIKNNYGHCFSCGKTVDTIQFVKETRNMSFREAINFLT